MSATTVARRVGRAATAARRRAARRAARCLEDGGVALFGADTVYGSAATRNAGAVERSAFALRARTDEARAVAFFSLAAALDALPELGERTARRAGGAAARPADAAGPQPGGASRSPAAAPRLRVIDIGIELDRPVLQSSANLAVGATRARSPRSRPRFAAAVDLEIDRGELRDAIDGRRPVRVRGRRLVHVIRAGALTAADVDDALVGSVR